MPSYDMKESQLQFKDIKDTNAPNVVVIGGGTGLSVMLTGLKKYTPNITAVVTVSDDGGGSGILRNELGILPPGDIRNCMLALAETQPVIKRLLAYRFPQGELKGQSFGNLFLAAMAGISDSFPEAVRMMSEVLAVTGEVIPVTDRYVELGATLEDGTKICGESKIGKYRKYNDSPIADLYLIPNNPKPVPEVIEKIREADIIVLGPGSLYTSVLPNLLVEGVAEEIRKSSAKTAYICNIMTQPGETDGFTAEDHLRVLSWFGVIADYMIVNSVAAPTKILERYRAEGAEQVRWENEVLKLGHTIIKPEDILSVEKGYIRHDADKLSKIIIKLTEEQSR